MPFGFSGALDGALLCFLLLGFDAAAMAAEEVKTRKKMCQEESLVDTDCYCPFTSS